MKKDQSDQRTSGRLPRVVFVGLVLGLLLVGLLAGYKRLLVSWVGGSSSTRRVYALRSSFVNTGDLSDTILTI